MKFGGTSVASAERMKQIAFIVSSKPDVFIVLSATSGTTDKLIKIHQAAVENNEAVWKALLQEVYEKHLLICDELLTGLCHEQALNWIQASIELIKKIVYEQEPNAEKTIIAQGEILSTSIFYNYLCHLDKSVSFLSALDFMRIDENAEPDMKLTKTYLALEMNKVKKSNYYITQGFICRNILGEVDNLKRGGSDYSASIIGSILHAEEIQIWTDVDGMCETDPRIIANAKVIPAVSFDEAAELAYFGAKILHPSTILPAREACIPVRLLNTLNPASHGTIITLEVKGTGIKAMAAKDNITAIKVKSGRMLMAYGFLRSVFEVFERYKTPIDMITTSEVSVSLTIDNTSYLNEIINELSNFGQVEIDTSQSIISLVGDSISDIDGISAQVLNSITNIPIRMVSIGGSKNNITILISSLYKQKCINQLYDALFANR